MGFASTRQWILLILLAITATALQMFGTLHFSFVFFGLQTDTMTASSEKVNSSLLYHSDLAELGDLASREANFGRMVLMVVDALRWDMAASGNMPFLQRLVRSTTSSRKDEPKMLGRLYRSVAETPTVTMSRVKAMMTGSLPKFMDVLSNFDSQTVSRDNVLRRLKEDINASIVFYGDETWIKLFSKSFPRPESLQVVDNDHGPAHPNHHHHHHDSSSYREKSFPISKAQNLFHRFEGTTSFFTKDFYEVDNNITRHLHEELDPTLTHPHAQDWDILVMHYLGLDHIGHQLGPNNEIMQEKQKEMDSLLHDIYVNLTLQDKVLQARARKLGHSFKPTLLVLTSDHGMTEVGSHGGASQEEVSAVLVLAPILTASPQQQKHVDVAETPIAEVSIKQTDMAPTLAVLMGAHIPRSSIGHIIETAFESNESRLRALVKNARQLQHLMVSLMQGSHPANGHIADLPDDFKASSDHDAAQIRVDAARDEDLLNAWQSCQDAVKKSVNMYNSWKQFGNDTQGLNLKACEDPLRSCLQTAEQVLRDRLSPTGAPSGYLFGLATLFFSILTCLQSLWLLPNSSPSKWKLQEVSIFIGVAIVFPMVLSSSSFIENEHSIWFFSLSSWLLIHLLRQSSLLAACRVLACLLVLRVARERVAIINFPFLNTGGGAAKAEFVAGSSILQEALGTQWHIEAIITTAFCALVLYFNLSRREVLCERKELQKKWKGLESFLGFLCIVGFLACLFDKMATSPQEASNIWPRLVYLICWFMWTLGLIYTCFGPTIVELKFCSKQTLSFSPCLWPWHVVSFTMVTIILHRKEEAMMVVLMVIGGMVLLSILHKSQLKFAVAHVVFLAYGNCFFYALGNSHLVATIDVAAGYRGLSNFHPVLCGGLIFLNTHAAPLFSIFLSWIFVKGTQRAKREHGLEAILIVLVLRSLSVLINGGILLAMRYHLFVWSVFAPKFCYEVARCVVITICVVVLLCWELVQGRPTQDI